MSRRCKNHPDSFYFWGEYTLKIQQHNIVYSVVSKHMCVTFECEVRDQVKHGLHMSPALTLACSLKACIEMHKGKILNKDNNFTQLVDL